MVCSAFSWKNIAVFFAANEGQASESEADEKNLGRNGSLFSAPILFVYVYTVQSSTFTFQLTELKITTV